jgi:hypothetical protein
MLVHARLTFVLFLCSFFLYYFCFGVCLLCCLPRRELSGAAANLVLSTSCYQLLLMTLMFAWFALAHSVHSCW